MLAALLSITVNSACAEGFLARDFLQLPDASKKCWLHGAMMTFSYMAATHSRDMGQCVYEWYFSKQLGERNSLILASMEKYPDVSPTAVLLALTERACGKYSGSESKVGN